MLPIPQLRVNAVQVAVRRFGAEVFWLFSRSFPLLVPGLAAILFGSVLLLPYDTFATVQAFSEMSQYASERVWGIGISAVGFLHLVMLATAPRFHPIAALPLSGLFVSIAAMIYQSAGLASTGTPIYALLAALSAWAASARLESHAG